MLKNEIEKTKTEPKTKKMWNITARVASIIIRTLEATSNNVEKQTRNYQTKSKHHS